MTAADPIVSVRDLQVRFQTTDRRATVKAVDGVNFDVRRGETFGIIGESGSGKTTIGRTLVFLLKPSAGAILHGGIDPLALPRKKFQNHRRDYQIIFQDPNAALNPRMEIAPEQMYAPGLAILVVSLAFNALGESLRIVLDPTMPAVRASVAATQPSTLRCSLIAGIPVAQAPPIEPSPLPMLLPA